MKRILILGGARSGKSRYAESIASAYSKKIYVATAAAYDEEMADRIRMHKQQRGDDWHTIEECIALQAVIKENMKDENVILVDCLTLWLTNILLGDYDLQKECDHLKSVLKETKGTVIMVSNEVGLSIVPENALARQFRDAAGRLNQDIASTCDDVYFVCAGIPLKIK